MTSLEEPLSPELVLVDPELAASARARLNVRPAAIPRTRRESLAHPRPAGVSSAPVPPLETRRTGQRSRTIVGAIVLIGALLGVTGSGSVTAASAPTELRSDAPRTIAAETLPAATPRATPPTVTPRSKPSRKAAEPPPAKPSPAAGKAPTSAPTPTPAAPTPAPTPKSAPRSSGSQSPVAEPEADGGKPTDFAWVPVADASHYRVEFFRGSTRIFLSFPAEARLTIPASWRYRGKTHAFEPGRYRWTVRPGYGQLRNARYGAPTIASAWLVEG